MPVTKVDQVANRTALSAAALAFAAGLLHIAVTRTHLAESTLDGVLMLGAAWVQLGFAVALLVAPTRLVRLAGAGALFVIVAGWAVARITGLPFGHSEGAPEEVRLLGTVATVLGALAGLVALAGVRPTSDPTGPAGPPSPGVLAAAGTALVALVSVAIVVSPTGHASGGHGSDVDGHPSGGASDSGDHHEQPASGTSGSAGTDSGTTGSGTTPRAGTPSPRHDGGDGHEHAPEEGH